jgi:hypothetical protein
MNNIEYQINSEKLISNCLKDIKQSNFVKEYNDKYQITKNTIYLKSIENAKKMFIEEFSKEINCTIEKMLSQFKNVCNVDFDIYKNFVYKEETEYGIISYTHVMCNFYSNTNYENLFSKFQDELAKKGYHLYMNDKYEIILAINK